MDHFERNWIYINTLMQHTYRVSPFPHVWIEKGRHRSMLMGCALILALPPVPLCSGLHCYCQTLHINFISFS